MIEISCSWCHTSADPGLCPWCGHENDVPQMLCHCDHCQYGEQSAPAPSRIRELTGTD